MNYLNRSAPFLEKLVKSFTLLDLHLNFPSISWLPLTTFVRKSYSYLLQPKQYPWWTNIMRLDGMSYNDHKYCKKTMNWWQQRLHFKIVSLHGPVVISLYLKVLAGHPSLVTDSLSSAAVSFFITSQHLWLSSMLKDHARNDKLSLRNPYYDVCFASGLLTWEILILFS